MGDWKPPEGPSRMATPPTGLSRSDQSAGGAAASSGGSDETGPCPRCNAVNAPHMRFCNSCGYQLRNESAAAANRPPETRDSASASDLKASSDGSAGGQGTVCWRCYGVGDAGAEFCKFCGARYSDAPSARAAEPSPPRVETPMAAPIPATGAPVERAVVEAARRPLEDPRPRGGDARQLGLLISILKDGTDGRSYTIHDEVTDIGREEGQVVLRDDPYLSPRHARLTTRNGVAMLRDLDSVNGIYIRLREPVDLADGDMVLLGQQVLRFEQLSEMELPLGPATQHGVMVFGTPEVQRIARLVQYTTEGVGRDVHYLYRDETVIGREQGDLVFTDDPFMSRRHAAVTVDRASRRFVLRDLGSSNGTAVRFRGERTLKPGDQFRVGRHLFRFEIGRGDAGGNGR
ncbi:MAG: FHA domain-containing protein [Sandaracinaceae bacterium]